MSVEKKIRRRIAESVAAGIKPYRPPKEEWVCPNCGLNGDHMKVPISDKRCKGCCTTDAANELLDVARRALSWVQGEERETLESLRVGLREAIAKAEGRA